MRDGEHHLIEATDLVPGDVIVITEGDRVAADAGSSTDRSRSTSRRSPANRSRPTALPTRLIPAPSCSNAADLVFSGTSCTGGDARAVVFATGMLTQLGRVAALSQRVEADESPLQLQVPRRDADRRRGGRRRGGVRPDRHRDRRPALADAVTFAIGLLVANVPEGLLPTITLALAAGARTLAQRRALVKRLSAVETLGSTTVICTDKTGTLTENRMRATAIWSPAGAVTWDTAPEPVRHPAGGAAPCRARPRHAPTPSSAPMARPQVAAATRPSSPCWRSRRGSGRLRARGPRDGSPAAVPLRLRREADVDGRRRRRHAGDPREGAPDVLLDRCTTTIDANGDPVALDAAPPARSSRAPRRRRPRACACWPSPTASWIPARRCPPHARRPSATRV